LPADRFYFCCATSSLFPEDIYVFATRAIIWNPLLHVSFTCSYVSFLCDWLLLAIPLTVACCLWIFLLTWGHSPVSAAVYGRCCCFVDRLLLWLLLSMSLTGLLALWSLLMSHHHRGTRALLCISAKVSLRGCRSCGCFSTMPLASMVRTLVSLVDVPDAIRLSEVAGTHY
jgi:hypothetical protein